MVKYTESPFIGNQEITGRLLQDSIDHEGTAAFLKTEEKTILSLHCRNAIIATGGSVVFSEKAMDHLKKMVWLSTLISPFRKWYGDSIISRPGELS